jgi:hypothetical protein
MKAAISAFFTGYPTPQNIDDVFGPYFEDVGGKI